MASDGGEHQGQRIKKTSYPLGVMGESWLAQFRVSQVMRHDRKVQDGKVRSGFITTQFLDVSHKKFHRGIIPNHLPELPNMGTILCSLSN
ncbi:MAG: hypothetical protein OXH22_12460 [Chloroflexi bacterium]|nr:hypothetical protein [Chloroflexota bacterium]